MLQKDFQQTHGVIDQLIEELNRLPGIGPKTAERLAFHLLSTDRDQVLQLAEAIREVKEKIQLCQQCHNLTEKELCSICSDPKRDAGAICVVEQAKDIAFIEKTGKYRGVYHVLHGRIDPLENMGPEALTVDTLLRRVQSGTVREVIMATNPNTVGDGTALYVTNLLAPTNVRVTRLARGLSSGSTLEFANKEMLADALEGRREF